MGIFNYHWNIKIDVALQNYSIGIKSTPIKLKHKQWMICNIKERRPPWGGAPNPGAPCGAKIGGAPPPDRVSRGLGQGVLVSLSMTLVLCLCQILGISLIIRAFQLDEAAAAICRLHLFSSAVAIPIFAVYFPANGMCQGVGEGFYATFFALLALGLRVIFTSIWWSQAMAWTVTLIVCYAHFFRGKWKTKSLIS